MDELFNIIGEQLAAIAEHPLVVFGARAVAAYLTILWLASAYWVYRDLGRRTRDPISPYAAAAAIVVFTPLFFPLAVLAYRLMRPSTTLAERRALDLESELLTRQVAIIPCSGCGRAVDETWRRCPYCATWIGMECPACGERVAADWAVCAWCAHDFEEDLEPEEAPRLVELPSGIAASIELADAGLPTGPSTRLDRRPGLGTGSALGLPAAHGRTP